MQIVRTLKTKDLNRLLLAGMLFSAAGPVIGQTLRLDWTLVGGGPRLDMAMSVAVDSGGNPVVFGGIVGTIDLSSGQTFVGQGPGAFLAKLTNSGTVTWLSRLSGAGLLRGDMRMDGQGNTYVCGSIDPAGKFDAYAAKFNSLGELLWLQELSGDGAETAFSVAVDSSGNCYVTGQLSTPLTTVFEGIPVATANGRRYTGFLVKFGPDGTKLRKRLIALGEPDNGGGYAWPRASALDQQGNLYLAGDFFGPVSFDSITLDGILPSALSYNEGGFVAKLDANWNVTWAKAAEAFTDSDATPSFAMFRDIKIDADGNCLITGSFEPRLIVGTNELAGNGGWDIVIARYSATGDILWAKSAGGPSIDSGERLVILSDSGDFALAGYFQGAASFPGTNITSQGVQDLFVASYDHNGEPLRFSTIGANAMAYFGAGIDRGPDGAVYVAGSRIRNPQQNDRGFVDNQDDLDIVVAKLVFDTGDPNAASARLLLSIEAGQLVLSWPKTLGGVLESAAALGADPAGWKAVEATPDAGPTHKMVRVNPASATAFFRLRSVQ